jgi:MFS family permease
MTGGNSRASGGRKTEILVSVCLAALVLPLSFSGGAVATPAIGRYLGGDPLALNWITNAFMLSFGSLLMAAGALADQYGRKRLFIIGVASFVIISTALSFAPTVLALDLLRAAQGVAAAAALAGGSAALAQEFEGRARTRAFSALGATFGVGLAFGPILAGVLVGNFGWRLNFVSSAVIGALALLFGAPRMSESRDPNAAGLDWRGTIAFTGALSLFTFGMIEAPTSGWSSPLVVALLLAAAALLGAFIVVETSIARPMLDLSLFRYPRFIGVQLLPVATCYCYVVLLVLLPLRFIGVEDYGEVDAGFLMMALSAPMLGAPFLAAGLTRRISAGAVSGVGLMIAAAGLLWLSRIAFARASYAAVPPMLLIGFGAGLPWGLMDGLAVSVVPKERAGVATGIFSTTRVAGEGIALAIVVAILASFTQSSLRGVLKDSDPGILARTVEAGQRLAGGDLDHAWLILPELDRSLLVGAYDAAFRDLLYVLTAVTLLSALAVFGLLGGERTRAADLEVDASMADRFPSRSK